MEIKIDLSERYLKAAASTLILAAADDEDYEEMINDAVEGCKGLSLTLDPSDFGDAAGKKFCIGLAVYAIGKVMKVNAEKEEREFFDMLKKGLKTV